jgi:hypothetical protein
MGCPYAKLAPTVTDTFTGAGFMTVKVYVGEVTVKAELEPAKLLLTDMYKLCAPALRPAELNIAVQPEAVTSL